MIRTDYNKDDSGGYQPNGLIESSPFFAWPPRPSKAVKHLFNCPGYLLPWYPMYVTIALITWFVLTPDLADMQSFEFRWITTIYFRNIGLLILIWGTWHFRFYVQRAQGTRYKYDKSWPRKHRRFLFGDQTKDNMFWSIVSGCSIWTAYEVVTYWMFANGYISFLEFRQHPLFFVFLLLLIPLIHDTHFYFGHRLLHWKPLYKLVHYIHHKNINVGPWSGLSMHPIEHVIYFSGVLLYWIIPIHPLHGLLYMQYVALAPAHSHVGFDKMIVGKKLQIPNTGDYFHYLHHRYFECNYGGGAVPLDSWFGTFHDSSNESHHAMRVKRRHLHG